MYEPEDGGLTTSDIYDRLEAGTASEDIGAEPEAAPTEATEPAYEAPQHWRQEHRELFTRHPRDVQEFILQRHREMEGDYTRRTQQLAEERRQYERQLQIAQSAKEIWGPLAQRYAAQGMDEVAVQRMASAYLHAYTQDPKGFITSLAQQVGISIPQPEDEYVDPAVKQLRDELAQTKEHIAQQQQFRAQFEQAARVAQEQQAKAQLQSTWHAFASKAGPDGKPLYPHANNEKVRIYMGTLLQRHANDPDVSLERVYAQAVEDLKGALVTTDPAARVRQAKRAATGVQGVGGSQPMAGTRREFMAQVFDQLAQR
jgi:hypothetical protein